MSMYEYHGIIIIDQFMDIALLDRLISMQPYADNTLKVFYERYGKTGLILISLELKPRTSSFMLFNACGYSL